MPRNATDTKRIIARFDDFIKEYSCYEECGVLGLPPDSSCANFIHYYKLILIVVWSQALEHVYPKEAKKIFSSFMKELENSLPPNRRKEQAKMIKESMSVISGMFMQEEGVVQLAKQCVQTFGANPQEDDSDLTIRLTRLILEHLQRFVDELTRMREGGAVADDYSGLSNALASAFSGSRSPAAEAAPSKPAANRPSPAAAKPERPAAAKPERPAAAKPEKKAAANPSPQAKPAAPSRPAPPPQEPTPPQPEEEPSAAELEEESEFEYVAFDDDEYSIVIGDEEVMDEDANVLRTGTERIPEPPPSNLFQDAETSNKRSATGTGAAQNSSQAETRRNTRLTAGDKKAYQPEVHGDRRRAERVPADKLSILDNQAAQHLQIRDISESGLAAFHDGWTFQSDSVLSVDLCHSWKVLMKDLHCKVVRSDGSIMACTFIDMDSQTQLKLRAIVKHFKKLKSAKSTKQTKES